MKPWLIAILVQPFFLFVLFLFVAYPARVLVERHAPDCKLKEFMLRTVQDKQRLTPSLWVTRFMRYIIGVGLGLIAIYAFTLVYY